MHDASLLLNLFKLIGEGKLDRYKFMQMLARALVQEIAASRAGIWFYQGALQDSLVCETLYDAGDGQWTSGMVLHEDDFQPYFESMREGRILVAPNARQHPATACFSEGYLEPLNIYSRLDVVIDVAGSLVGVLSCEQTAHEHDWTQQDLQYLQQGAATIGLALKKFP
ncbi:GAF domain-containing protein [Chitinimonas sp.]|uniref:GAF domain-containing protein n=1 Tax=Chitinimonas sp. TaxID=1934313 RepID=UPI0035B0BC42